MYRTAPLSAARAAALAAAFSIATLIPGPAAAYVGPGAGLSAIGTVLALVAAIFLAIVGFVWYPLKRVLNKSGHKQTKDRDSQAGA